jgi:hypothetical protein
MTRKPDPENIYMARRTARFRRLVDEERVDELEAEHLITAWEREEARGLDRHASSFWPTGEEWMAARRRKK